MVVFRVAYENYGQYFSLLPAIPTMGPLWRTVEELSEKTTRTLCLNNVMDVACLPVTWARHSYRELDAAIALPRSYMALGVLCTEQVMWVAVSAIPIGPGPELHLIALSQSHRELRSENGIWRP
jgi:hypothetical protein